MNINGTLDKSAGLSSQEDSTVRISLYNKENQILRRT